jgi:hypothetical protein
MKCYAILDLRYRTGVCLVRPFVVPCPVSRSPHPFKMRVGCGPVGAERVCDRLATQNGCTGWKGRCGGSGPPGRGGGGWARSSFFRSSRLPSLVFLSLSLSPPSLARTAFPIVFQHLVELQIRISVVRRIFSIPSSHPIDLAIVLSWRRHLVVVSGGGRRGWGKAESVFCLLFCAAIWTLRCDFTLAFFSFCFCGFPYQCW